MSLNRIISDAVEAHEHDGVINRHAAITDTVPLILADAEMTETCVRGHVSRLITKSAKARAAASANNDPAQLSIFGLNEMHILDDGEGTIKRTRQLSRLEFAGLIRVRQVKVEQDLAYLAKLREAFTVTSKIWDQHPTWSWGEVEDAYARMKRVA